ncbi:hypothetical protein N7528_008588 [Penicillium herquei]|nr:hypothetical protein N7528_008588 [Penicillium herquei]
MGSLKVDENIFSYDVFGRLLYHNWSLTLIKDSDVEAYGITFQVGDKFKRVKSELEPTMYSAGDDILYDVRFVEPNDFWFPTICKIKGRGLRLYATYYLVDKDGKARIRQEMPYGYSKDNLSWEYEVNRKSRRMGEDHTPGLVKPKKDDDDEEEDEPLPGDPKICRTVRMVSNPRKVAQT